MRASQHKATRWPKFQMPTNEPDNKREWELEDGTTLGMMDMPEELHAILLRAETEQARKHYAVLVGWWLVKKLTIVAEKHGIEPAVELATSDMNWFGDELNGEPETWLDGCIRRWQVHRDYSDVTRTRVMRGLEKLVLQFVAGAA